MPRPLRALSGRRPEAVLAAGMAFYVGVFLPLALRQHDRWRSLGFDTAIHDQGIWLTAHGNDPFVTIRGIDYFGHHVNLISLLFVPLYRWFGAGVPTLIVVHTLWVASAAVPLWLLARDRFGGHSCAALCLPAAYLLHPATQWITWWLYHPDSMAIAPLLWAWWLATQRRWAWFAVAALVAVSCKEDVALAVAAMGVALAVLRPGGTDPAKDPGAGPRRVRAGLVTAALALAWFFVCTRLVIPHRTGVSQPFYESFFPDLGRTPGEIAKNAVLHPSRVTNLLGRPKNGTYLWRMAGPLGGLPILALPAMLPGVPQLGVNLLVQTVDGATIVSQYATLPLVGLLIATAEGLGLLVRRWAVLRLPLVVLLTLSALVGSAAYGCGPGSQNYRDGTWALEPRPEVPTLERVRRLVPADAGVAASYDIDAHFSHRQVDYEWPNPWQSRNYGTDGASYGRASDVEWIVLTVAGAGTEDDLELLGRLVGPDGDFEEVLSEGGVFVARRRAPAAGSVTAP